MAKGGELTGSQQLMVVSPGLKASIISGFEGEQGCEGPEQRVGRKLVL